MVVTNEMFLDDDGAGNVRLILLVFDSIKNIMTIQHKAQLIMRQVKLHYKLFKCAQYQILEARLQL